MRNDRYARRTFLKFTGGLLFSGRVGAAADGAGVSLEVVREKPVPVFPSSGDRFYRLPSLIVAADGALLAACQKRKGNAGDWAESALVTKRSVDGGRTWSKEQTLHERPGFCTFNGNLVEDRRAGRLLALFITFPRAAGRAWFPEEWIPEGGFWQVVSTDDGENWSEPIHKVPAPNADGWRGGAAYNNNHGVQLTRGPDAGRLVAGGRVFRPGGYEGRTKGGLIYSDDQGESWRVGAVGFPERGPINGEVALCETGGEVYASFRAREKQKPWHRLYGRSEDGGESFYEMGEQKDLAAHGCNAGLASVRRGRSASGLLLFTYPRRPDRRQLSCYMSRDGGRSWANGKVIAEGGGYSDVAVLPDGTIIVLYERSHRAGLYVVRFSLEWLLK